MDDLLQRARHGDGDAFAELFDGCAHALWKTAASVMGDEDAAADMLQETAIKAWRSIPSFNEGCALATWLTRILLNACFDELRSKKRLVPFGDIAKAVDAGSAVPCFAGAHEGGADACERMDIDRTLSRLTADDRMILTLFYVNDMPTSQISEVLGISEGAVRTRLSRARARFKEIHEKPARTSVAIHAMTIAEAAI